MPYDNTLIKLHHCFKRHILYARAFVILIHNYPIRKFVIYVFRIFCLCYVSLKILLTIIHAIAEKDVTYAETSLPLILPRLVWESMDLILATFAADSVFVGFFVSKFHRKENSHFLIAFLDVIWNSLYCVRSMKTLTYASLVSSVAIWFLPRSVVLKVLRYSDEQWLQFEKCAILCYFSTINSFSFVTFVFGSLYEIVFKGWNVLYVHHNWNLWTLVDLSTCWYIVVTIVLIMLNWTGLLWLKCLQLYYQVFSLIFIEKLLKRTWFCCLCDTKFIIYVYL